MPGCSIAGRLAYRKRRDDATSPDRSPTGQDPASVSLRRGLVHREQDKLAKIQAEGGATSKSAQVGVGDRNAGVRVGGVFEVARVLGRREAPDVYR